MREAGKSEEALKHLSSCDSHICDVLTLYEMKGSYFLSHITSFSPSRGLIALSQACVIDIHRALWGECKRVI